ncbi:hypothetical protein CP532_3229 [Ophiocordyceps camponoti-leonardi (nom. inval.)]|nr:hypothetical protein CP532_3229 [Ophiocordyceps camponoti-leonardi (nom. inval.)]
MASTKPKAETITRPDFNALLAQYPTLLEATSKAKAGTPSRRADDNKDNDNDEKNKSLAELDRYRYVTAPSIFGPESRERGMDLEDVKRLVEWKLRHGTFRPKLLSLVSSNAANTVQTTIQEALTSYESSPTTALTKLTTLKGIGPATASLLLSVHDPPRCIFFSDEAFRWLCRGGDARAPIRYTVAEYRALGEAADAVARRIGVEAVELEKVAYVVMRGGGLAASPPSVFDPALLSALPSAATSATAASVRLARDTHVQVLDVEDLSLSRWEQAEALREVARGERTTGRQIVRVDDGADGGDADEAQQRPASEPSRRNDNATHRLVLQDCRGTRVYAVELRRLPRIGVRSTAMGEKILLRAGTIVARGTVLLAPESCLLLGGRVDAWHDAWANSRLQRLEEGANN